MNKDLQKATVFIIMYVLQRVVNFLIFFGLLKVIIFSETIRNDISVIIVAIILFSLILLIEFYELLKITHNLKNKNGE